MGTLPGKRHRFKKKIKSVGQECPTHTSRLVGSLIDFGAHFRREMLIEIEVEFQNINSGLAEKSKLPGFSVLGYQRA